MDSLTENLNSLKLSTNCVPFNPTGENANSINADFANTPRYLFHVYDSKTKSTTDDKWVKSLDAMNDEGNHMDDLFKRSNAGDVARELNETFGGHRQPPRERTTLSRGVTRSHSQLHMRFIETSIRV
jgi:hypothetical protein